MGAAETGANHQVWRERLTAPLSWWLLGAGFVGTVVWIVWVVAPGLAAAVTGVVAAVAVTCLLLRLGSTIVAVEAGPAGALLVAGRARLPVSAVTAVTPLDAAQRHRLAGVEADARAFLVLPPFVATAVRVELDDPADSTPYWLVATRHPHRLAAAIDAAIDTAIDTAPRTGAAPATGPVTD